MARWYGADDSLGQVQKAAIADALHALASMFPAVVVMVRTHPTDDEYATIGAETGDPAICEAMAGEYGAVDWDDEDED